MKNIFKNKKIINTVYLSIISILIISVGILIHKQRECENEIIIIKCYLNDIYIELDNKVDKDTNKNRRY